MTPHLDALAAEGVSGDCASRSAPGSRRARGPATSGSSATTRRRSSSGGARCRPRASTSSCRPVTSRHAATSARSTPTASSPTAGPVASPTPTRAGRRRQAPGRRPPRRRRGVLPPRARAPAARRAARPGPRPAADRHRPAGDRRPTARGRARSTPRPSAPPSSSTELGDAGARRARRRAEGRTTSCCAASTRTASLPYVRRSLRAARRGRRHLPDVPRDRRACSAWTCSAGRRTSTSSSTILRDAWADYDYFFLHHKYTDSAGEDGDRARKIAAIETLDAVVPQAAGARTRRHRRDRRPLDAVAARRALVAPGSRRCCGARDCGRDDVTQYGERWCLPRRPRHPAHQGPDGDHARQRRPPQKYGA